MLRLKKVDKLVALAVMGAVLLTWLLLIGFDTAKSFIVAAGDIGQGEFGWTSAVLSVLLTVPRRAYEWFAYASLIGGLLGLGTLAGTGELTALRAAGLSKSRICASVVAAIAVLAVTVVVIGETIGPAGDQKAQAYALQAKSKDITLTKRSGLWARDGAAVINAKRGTTRQTPEGREVVLSDVRVFEFTPEGQLSSIALAKTAEHRKGSWVMHEVRRTEFVDNAAKTTTEATSAWKSGLDPRMLSLSIVNVEYMALRDLARGIAYLERNQQDSLSFRRAYWARVFYPLNILLLAFCAMPFAFGTLRTGGLGKRIFIGIVLSVIWYFAQRALVNLGIVYNLPPGLAHLLPGLVMALAAGAYFWRRA